METIQITYGIEDLVSRIPGLFPYLEFCENGVTVVHSAKDSLNGCYGKIVCGIKLPDDVNLVVGGVELLGFGCSYSYRTLMILYYKYLEALTHNNPFIAFMDRCIGLVRISDYVDISEYDLVPEFCYYAECSRLYSEYCSMSRMCSQYIQMKSDMSEVNCEMECLLEKYRRMGGDTMKEFYRLRSDEAEEIADQILESSADIDAATIDFRLNFSNTENDLGVLSIWLNHWEPNVRYSGGDIVVYNGRTYVCTCGEGEYTDGKWDEDTETLVFDDDNFIVLSGIDDEDYELSGTFESSLNIFKESTTYVDEGGNVRVPENNEDWLWYYKVGSFANYEAETDGIGNITVKEGCERCTVVGEYDENLMAFGDILTSIDFNEEDTSVTFTYVLGANLKAVLTDAVTDNDGNTRYYYGRYAYNSNDSHGVTCTETYPFVGDLSEITEIVENNDFEAYTTGTQIDYQYYTCPFSTDTNSDLIQMTVNGVPVNKRVVITSFVASADGSKDETVSPVFKKDYLVGVVFNPKVDSEVFVNRGNAAAWERHIKLGEVKSFEDLENYSNNGFFNFM